MTESSYTEYNELAQLTISLNNDIDKKKTYELVETKVLTARTHAYAVPNEDLQRTSTSGYLEEKFKFHWYRSTDTIFSENPFSNWLTKGSYQSWKNKAKYLFDVVKSLCHFKT